MQAEAAYVQACQEAYAAAVAGLHRPFDEVEAPLARGFLFNAESGAGASNICGLPMDWEALDPDDPPRFESQAVYLRRHGLLTDAEQRRLSTSDFEPEAIDVADLIDEAAE